MAAGGWGRLAALGVMQQASWSAHGQVQVGLALCAAVGLTTMSKAHPDLPPHICGCIYR